MNTASGFYLAHQNPLNVIRFRKLRTPTAVNQTVHVDRKVESDEIICSIEIIRRGAKLEIKETISSSNFLRSATASSIECSSNSMYYSLYRSIMKHSYLRWERSSWTKEFFRSRVARVRGRVNTSTAPVCAPQMMPASVWC